MKTVLLLCLSTLAVSLSALPPKAVMPLSQDKPVIDGIVDPGEWRNSLRIGGFLRPSPEARLNAGGDGFVNFACDGKFLYVAFRTPAKNFDPGGGLKTDAQDRDSAVYDDDSVELMMIPDTAQGKMMYQFIFNGNGVVFDRACDRNGTWNVKWNCPGLKVASVVKSGWWELEAAIPLAALNLPKKSIRLNACRNIAGDGPSALIATTDYFSTGAMFELEWRKGVPAVQMTAVGTPAVGQWNPELMIGAAPEGKTVFADMEIREYKGGSQSGECVFRDAKTLKCGQKLTGRYDTLSRELHSIEINVRDGDTGELLLSRQFYGRRGAKTEGIPPSCEFDLPGIGSGMVFYYPGKNQARFFVEPSPGSKICAVKLMIGGKEILLKQKNGTFSAMGDTPPTAGNHPADLHVTFGDGTERIISKAFSLEKKHFVWENNSLGKEQIVIPPFNPVRAEGNVLKVILRDYAMSPSGLPRSIRAMDREILAGEAYYELTADGKTMRFSGEQPSIRVTENGCSAEILASSYAPNGMELKSRGHFEYDGFLWNELRLNHTAGKTIERFTLVIPFKNSEVPLYHAATADSIRFNPTGALPQGEGIIWSGDKLYRKSSFLDKMQAPQAVPYLWLGAERRGLAWFINNTVGMKLDAEKPSVRIVRRNELLRLEIDFINRPVRLREGHPLAFGLQATPVKMPDPALQRHFQSAYPEHPKNMVSRMEIYECSGGYFNRWARHPWKEDWKLFEQGYALANTGKGVDAFRKAGEKWRNQYDSDLAQYCSRLQNIGQETYLQWFLRGIRETSSLMMRIQEPVYPFKYSDPTLTWEKDDAVQYFKSEWISRSTGYIGAIRAFLTPSYINFILYYSHEELKRGLKGVYFDDMFPMTCRNADTCAETDEDGLIHGNYGILEMRELVKRTAVMQHKMGISPRLLQIHMTNCLLVPCFSFSTSLLSWEDHFGEDEFQKRYPIDYIRAESLGSQVGAESVALDGIYRRKTTPEKWRERFAFLTRTQQALLLPAGVKIWRRLSSPVNGVHKDTLFGILNVLGDFEIWAEDCRFVPFYEDDGLISGVPDDVLLASYRRPGKVLVILGNRNEKRKTFKLLAEMKQLGLPPGSRCINAETGKPLPDAQVTLAGYDLAMILIVNP